MCSKCLGLLISACHIKQVCIDSDKKLKSQIESAFLIENPQPELFDLSMINENNCELTSEKIRKDLEGFEDQFEVRIQHSSENECSIQNGTSKPIRNTTFKSLLSIESKAKTHPTKQKLRECQSKIHCYICNIGFINKKEKSEHLDSFHTNDELKCKKCKHKSQTARGLDNHLMIHENPDLLFHMCHICGKKNYQKACELRRHIKLAHGDKSKRQINFYCDHCDFKTFSKMNMKRHLNTIHLKIKAFGCQLCPDKKYTSKITLEQHMISKHGQETDFVCQCCRRKFPTMSFLRSHLKSTCSGTPGAVRERGDPNEYREPLYDELDRYRCKLCGLIFEGKGKIAQHYAQRHKHSNSCSLCSATFNSYSNLKKHIQILHNKVHKYSCSYCSRSFGQKNQLQSHM